MSLPPLGAEWPGPNEKPEKEKDVLTWMNIHHLSSHVYQFLKKRFGNSQIRVFGIPRGGIYAALAVGKFFTSGNHYQLVTNPDGANCFIDDIVDSGDTRDFWTRKFPDLPFYSLIDKRGEHSDMKNWIEFPWESMTEKNGPEHNIIRILQYIGEEMPLRDGLKDTPVRVMKSYLHLFSGYKDDVSKHMKTFESDCDEMVILKDIPFYSTCEHHMLPFSGMAHIGYVPNGRVIGISKLSRILEVFARRLQIQERITSQVTEALMDTNNSLLPKGAGCVIEAKHHCMMCRGIEKQSSVMITSSLLGVFRDLPECRSEFLTMIKS